MFVKLTGRLLRKTQVGTDQQVTWANNDAANTQKTVIFTKPDYPVEEYKLIVYNPSTVTDLTVKVFSVSPNLGGADRDSLLTTFSVPKSQTVSGTTINSHIRLLHGIFNNANMKLVLSNDTALDASDGFSAYLRLREVM